MSPAEWNDTRKEYNVDESGSLKLAKVTSELKKKSFEKKDILEMVFKTIGVFAIGLPIYMVSIQQKAAINGQRATQQSDIIINTATEFKVIENFPASNAKFISSQDRLSNELSTKISLFFNDDINHQLETINETIALYGLVSRNAQICTSLVDFENELGGYLGSLDKFITKNDIDKEQHQQLDTIESLFADLLMVNKELDSWKINSTLSDSVANKLFIKTIALNKKTFNQHCSIKDSCKTVIVSSGETSQKIINSCQNINDLLDFLNNPGNLETNDVKKEYQYLQSEFLKVLEKACKQFIKNMKSSNKLMDG